MGARHEPGMTFKRCMIVLGVLTAAVYAALIGVGGVWLWPEAGGLVPFDLRPGGYGPEAAATYLAALSEAGRRAYLGPVAWLDTIFPPLLGLLLACPVWRAGWRGLAAVPVLYALSDLSENAVIRRMLVTGDAGLARWGSAFTQAKFVLAALAALIAWRAVRRRGNGAGRR